MAGFSTDEYIDKSPKKVVFYNKYTISLSICK